MNPLLKYIVKRLALLPFQIWLIFSIVFLLMRAIPVNPARAILGEGASEEAVLAYEKFLGLDKPIYVQYIQQLNMLIHGNLGVSYQTLLPVWHSIANHFPITVEVALGGMAIALLIGWPLGAIAAAKKGTLLDHIGRIYGGLLASMPVFWLGLMFQLAFLGKLPIQGIASAWNVFPHVTGFALIDSFLWGGLPSLIDVLEHYFLPWLTLGLIYSGIHSRFLRANMERTLNEEYIKYAKVRGLDWWKGIIFNHAFKNSIIPVVALVALHLATLLGGALITETVFNIPGMGLRLFIGIYSDDYPIVQGFMVFIGIIIVLTATIADIIIAIVDPRVRYT